MNAGVVVVDEEHRQLPHGVAMLLRWVPRSTFENAFGVSIDDNFLLLLPERQLPRLRVLMVLLRVIVVTLVIMKLLFSLVPPTALGFLMMDVLVVTPLCVYAMLFAAWAHARDLREKFHLEQLLLAPQGPAMLAQALFVRPLGTVGGLVAHYVLFSLVGLGLTFFLLGLMMGELILPTPIALLLITGSFLGPWAIIMTFMFAFSIDRGLRCEMIDKTPHVTVLIRVLMTIILGVGTFLSLIIVMTILIVPAIFFMWVVLVWVFILCWASIYASCLLHKRWVLPWMQNLMRKLGEDLNDAWREG